MLCIVESNPSFKISYCGSLGMLQKSDTYPDDLCGKKICVVGGMVNLSAYAMVSEVHIDMLFVQWNVRISKMSHTFDKTITPCDKFS